MTLCRACEGEFESRNPKAAYCCRHCYLRSAAKAFDGQRVSLTCAICGNVYKVPTHRAKVSKVCGRACGQKFAARSPNHREAKLAQRKAGLVKPSTYLKLYGRHEHRVVAEKKLGRALVKGEVVHHIDGDAHNNAPENLMVMTQSVHARLHSTKNRKCTVAGCGRKHVARGLCMRHYDKAKRAA